MNKFDDDFDDFDDSSSADNMQMGSLIRMVLSRWWLILLFAFFGSVVALYTLAISEPDYQATAVLEVITKQQQLVGDELENDTLTVDKTLSTIASKMVGRGHLAKVAQHPKVLAIEKALPPKFSPKPKYWRSEQEIAYQSAQDADPADLLGMITRSVEVKPRQATTLIDITVTHKDPEAASTIADVIMEVYLASEERRISGGASNAFKVLRTEADKVAKVLEIAQRSMHAYQSVIDTNEQLKGKLDELVLLSQRYKAKHPKMVQASAIHENLKQRFRREISMVGGIKNESEFWAQYRDQMANLERSIKTGVEDISKNAAEDWLSLVQGVLTARIGLLQGQIANRQLLYDTLTQRITEIDISEENNQGEIKIAEPAYSSGQAVTNKFVRLGQGVFGGIMLGCGLAYLLGRIDFKIYDVRTLQEASGLSCLAAIPSNNVFALEHEWQNVFAAEPNSVNAEAVRNLRASVLLLGKAERHKTILITSSIPGEGKTTIASELAASFALNDQKTILVDFDLRKPRVHTLFPYLDKSIGMSGVLAGHIELPKAVQKTKVDGLHVICAGTRAPNPSDLLHEEEIDNMISKLSAYYDRIIIDTPPVLPVSDTRVLVKHVHSVILVVRALKAPVGAIVRTKELLIQAKAPMAGVVLNGMKRKRGGGGGYYGYYGHYGDKGYGEYHEDEE